MKRIFVTFSVFVAVLFSSMAFSQQLKVATGSAKGTYAAQFREIQQFCANDLVMVQQETSGSVQNLDLLMNNQVNAGWVQTDILYRRARTENLDGIKTLVALHSEQLHFLAKVQSFKVGSTLGFGGQEVPLVDITQLAGKNLGAAGGSVETARQVRLDSEIPFNVVQYATSDEAIAALNGKDAPTAVLLVGGAPLGNIAGLGPEYRLLSVPANIAERLKGAYKPARLTYTKMNSTGVPTVAVDALFVTREYKTPKMIASLAALRGCILSKLDEIKETTGTHPSWQNVEASNKGKWPYYSLPETVRTNYKR